MFLVNCRKDTADQHVEANRELKEERVTLPQRLVDQPPLSGKVDCASPSTVFLNVSLGISKRKVNQSVSNRMREAKIPDLSTVETCGSHLQTCSPMQFHPANVRDFFHQNTENHCKRKSISSMEMPNRYDLAPVTLEPWHQILIWDDLSTRTWTLCLKERLTKHCIRDHTRVDSRYESRVQIQDVKPLIDRIGTVIARQGFTGLSKVSSEQLALQYHGSALRFLQWNRGMGWIGSTCRWC